MSFSITSNLIIDAARARGWTVNVIKEKYSLYSITLPDGSYHYLRNISSNKSGMANSLIAEKKDVLYSLAKQLGIRIPDTTYAEDHAKVRALVKKHKRLVVKPSDRAHGDGVTIDITNSDELESAIKYAKKFSDSVIVQQQVTGEDYRLLFIDSKLAAASIRQPAFVVGDGISTIKELIEAENGSSLRNNGYQDTLTSIHLTDASRYLGDSIETIIPQAGEEVRVMGTANIGKGGVSIDVTDTLDGSIVDAAQKVIDHLQIGIAGIDFIVDKTGQAYFIEINASPSLGLHEFPYKGQKRHTPDAFLDWLAK